MAWPQVFNLGRALLCEGPEDAAFFNLFIEHRGIPRFHICDTSPKRGAAGGNSAFRAALNSAKTTRSYANLRHVLVVADNDDDPPGRFALVCNQIEAAGFPRPVSPLQATHGYPAITVMMLPLQSQPGALETVCQQPARSAAQMTGQQVDHFVATVAHHGWTDLQRSKLWLRTMLAARYAQDPFLSLRKVFNEHPDLVPMGDASLDSIETALRALV